MKNTRFIKFNKILLFVGMVLILMILNPSNLYAATVDKLLQTEDYRYDIDGWDGSGAIANGFINVSWYYVLTNYEASDTTIGIDIHGAAPERS